MHKYEGRGPTGLMRYIRERHSFKESQGTCNFTDVIGPWNGIRITPFKEVRHLMATNDNGFPEMWCLKSDPYLMLAVRCK